MSNVPANLKYTDEHEWVRTEADGAVTIGLTDYVQRALGQLVFLELAPVGKVVKAGDAVGIVESVKAVSDIYAPVMGEVIAVNEDALELPEDINAEPYETWLFQIKLAAGAKTDGLLDATAYAKLIAQEG